MGFDSPVPPKPELSPFQAIVWEAFCALSRSRQYNMGPQPIQLSEMRTIFGFLYINREDHIDAAFLIQELDRVWLSEATGNKAQEAENGDKEGG